MRRMGGALTRPAAQGKCGLQLEPAGAAANFNATPFIQ